MEIKKIIGLVIVVIFSISTITTSAIGGFDYNSETEPVSPLITNKSIPYQGKLRIYIVEKESRWSDNSGTSYHFGFLDYAFDDKISIDYQETYNNKIMWKGDISEDNVIVMAAIFNQQATLGYSNPAFEKPFEAYAVDASTSATPGNIGYNTVSEDFTHTVFIEEATVSWCPDCPAMAETLYNIYQTNEYPFIYVALIGDMNPIAEPRYLDDYNLWGYPTGYFDGGKELLVGGIKDEFPYRSIIEYSGQKDVHELNLSLSVEWSGNGEIEIDITVSNNEEITIPIYEFGEVNGGLNSVSTTINNVGSEDVNDVEWNIHIKGGLLDLLHSHTEGSIETLSIDNKEIIQSKDPIFGFGKADIIISANAAVTVEKGFVLGPLVSIL
jgi:thiol-disulfide isomerase/thioredoxin